MEPERWLSKREKATRKVGSISKGLPGIPVGAMYYRAYQKAAGKNKNSGPSGKRWNRFYPERAYSRRKGR